LGGNTQSETKRRTCKAWPGHVDSKICHWNTSTITSSLASLRLVLAHGAKSLGFVSPLQGWWGLLQLAVLPIRRLLGSRCCRPSARRPRLRFPACANDADQTTSLSSLRASLAQIQYTRAAAG
jgi:hypothetical protein